MKNKIKLKNLLFGISIFLLFGCAKNNDTVVGNTSPPNILFILADDIGRDAMSGFSEGSVKANTPNINNIKNSGINFNNNWVYPVCSPTRAAIITGKYGYRTGVRWVYDPLSIDETILHKYIKEETNNAYATALIGKWHLGLENPKDWGMDYYTGPTGATVFDYYNWELRNEDGTYSLQENYVTEKETDLAIDWVNAQTKPWFLWLSYTAAHSPYHVPPSEMHSQGNLPEYADGMDPLPYFLANIEAMDYQIGRFLESMPENERENTVIIWVGDNGTESAVVQLPYTPVTTKGTLYQGGVNTPLYISGPGVTRIGETDNNLISPTDLFATIADIAGVSVTEIHDSKSFKSLFSTNSGTRNYQYAEVKSIPVTVAGDKWAISNGHYKLIVSVDGDEEMFDLTIDPYESNNLLNGVLNNNQIEAKSALENELLQIRN